MKKVLFVVFLAAIYGTMFSMNVHAPFGDWPKMLVGDDGTKSSAHYNFGGYDVSNVSINGSDTRLLKPVGDGSWYYICNDVTPGITVMEYRFLACDSSVSSVFGAESDNADSGYFAESSTYHRTITVPVTVGDSYIFFHKYASTRVVGLQPSTELIDSAPTYLLGTVYNMWPMNDATPDSSSQYGGDGYALDINGSGDTDLNTLSKNTYGIDLISQSSSDTTAILRWSIDDVNEIVNFSDSTQYGFEIFISSTGSAGPYYKMSDQYNTTGYNIIYYANSSSWDTYHTDTYIKIVNLDGDASMDEDDQRIVIDGLPTKANGGESIYVYVTAKDAYGMSSAYYSNLEARRVFPVSIIFVVMGGRDDVIFKDDPNNGMAYVTPIINGKVDFFNKQRVKLMKRQFKG